MWQAELSSFKGLGWERGSFFPPHQPSMWIQSLWSPLKRTCQCLHPPKRLECTLYQRQPCLSFIPLFMSVGRAVPAPALQQGRKRWFFWGGKEYRLPLPPPALCWSNVGATEPAHPQAWGKEKGMGARRGQGRRQSYWCECCNIPVGASSMLLFGAALSGTFVY